MGILFKVKFPFETWAIPRIALKIDDFPEPVSPTNPILWPYYTFKLKLWTISGKSIRYLMQTFLNYNVGY